MEHFLYYPGLDFVLEGIKLKIDSESGGKIIRTMRKNECQYILYMNPKVKWRDAGVSGGEDKLKTGVPSTSNSDAAGGCEFAEGQESKAV